MIISGWGNNPKIDADYLPVSSPAPRISAAQSGQSQIARGLGRSYGDSSLADLVWPMRRCDHLLEFDPEHGLLRCEAGVSLDEILQLIVPHGWFLPVTPGTKFVTLGGAIASDVHGKNHHIDGCFSDWVEQFSLLAGDNQVYACSKTNNTSLFLATCGGMGLTGIILQATIKLKKVESTAVNQTTYKANDLTHAFELFEQHTNAEYSVAWIDSASKGRKLGRSLIMTAEHHSKDSSTARQAHTEPALTMPCYAPNFLLNKYTVAAFNQLYYHRIRKPEQRGTLHYAPYFYPLDGINHWNRLYGKKGFMQYQFVIPDDNALNNMHKILGVIAESGKASFLSVLKKLGPANNNYLSFPLSGYTLALDFKFDRELPAFLQQLDHLVLDAGGRVYLTKDSCMNEQMFKSSYPNWEAFQEVRAQYQSLDAFSSLQSLRLGLNQ